MGIDWDDEGELPEQTRRLIGEPPLASRRPGLESMAAAKPAPEERLDRLATYLARRNAGPVSERPDPEMASQVLRGAASALGKVGDPKARYTLRERAGFEAVILTDGTRPSLTVTDGFVDLKDPEIGSWDRPFGVFGNAMRGVIAAVGRVNVPTTIGFAGTCFAIAPDLVLTNRHVIEEIAQQDADGNWTLSYPDATTIDFVAEAGASTSTRHKVVSVAYAGPDPIRRQVNFAHLDLAVLKLDPLGDLPAVVKLEKSIGTLEAGRRLYLVGFPAQPQTHFGGEAPPPGYETSAVMSSVFRWKFGVKKLAPGTVAKEPGDLPEDDRHWIFSHDASTLGGNSGSAVVDLSIDGARVVGLHFGGRARQENWAHALAQIDQLRHVANLDWI